MTIWHHRLGGVRGIRAGLFLAGILTSAAACGYRGALHPQFYEASSQTKIPLKILLVADDSFRSKHVVVPTGKGEINIALDPGLTNAVKAALAALFQEMSVADTVNQAGDVNFMVLPTADIRISFGEGIQAEPIRIALAFQDPAALAPVAMYEASTPVNWAPTTSEKALEVVGDIATPMTLYLMGPVAAKLTTTTRGERWIADIEHAISKNLQTISARIRNDQQKLVAYARGERPGTVVPRPPAPGPLLSISYPTEGARLSQERVSIVGVASGPKGASRIEVLVNSRPVPVTRDVRVQATDVNSHSFSAEVPLAPGANLITVTAVDADGFATQMVRSVFLEAGATPTGTVVAPARAGERWAVVIGIDRYRDPGIVPLRYAAADAEAVFQFLTAKGGVKPANARLLLNNDATQRGIRHVLGEFLRQKALKDDEVIIYYAGHGTTEPDAGAEGGLAKYLVPWDADPQSLFSSAIPMEEVDRVFGRLGARKILLIQDTCFSGGAGGRTFVAKGLTVRATTLTDKFLQDLSQKGGRMILTASDVNQVSVEDPALGHGIFTHFLLEALSGAADLDGDGAITVREVHLYLQRKVHERSNGVQTPQLYNIGDMVLVRRP